MTPPNPNLNLVVSLLLIFLTLSTAKPHNAPKDLLRSSCIHASYPTLCLKTLSSYTGPTNSPRDLAQAAVRVSLTRASKLSSFLSTLSVKTKKEKVALSDCVDQISESVDELTRTLSELKKMRNEGVEFKWELSNAQTWVSGALTNEDTCLDGFEEVQSGVRGEVRRKIGNVAKVTSNALYLINKLDESRGKPKLGV